MFTIATLSSRLYSLLIFFRVTIKLSVSPVATLAVVIFFKSLSLNKLISILSASLATASSNCVLVALGFVAI